MKTLFLITARGGSKGIPGKNVKKLNGIPLINYSIELARQFTSDENICLSTDDKKIASIAKRYDLIIPFLRPANLASDTASSNDVILHALNWYKKKGIEFDVVVLLQPTSPFRLKKDIRNALSKFSSKLEMVVSVTKFNSNPYSTLYKKQKGDTIEKAFSEKRIGSRRQDADKIYELNGAVYVFNVKSLFKKRITDFKNIKMVEMNSVNSVDIDYPLDWKWCEFLLKEKLVKLDYKVGQ